MARRDPFEGTQIGPDGVRRPVGEVDKSWNPNVQAAIEELKKLTDRVRGIRKREEESPPAVREEPL